MDRKRRAIDTKQASAQISVQGSEATATLPQRIGQSASGLLTKSFNRPSPRATTGILASLHTDNVKVSSSSSSTGTGESSLALRSSSQYGQATLDQGETFRSDAKGDKVGKPYGQFAFDDFLAGLNELDHESKFARDGPALGGEQQPGFPSGIAENNLSRVQERETWKTQDKNEDCADQNNDGAAVVALLSDPAFTVDEEASSTLDLGDDRWKERNDERLQIGKRSAKSVDASHRSNILDLVPDFSPRSSSSHASLVSQKDSHKRGHLLEPRPRNVQPWVDILDRYHDEVWGEMLPLVQEACEELEAADEIRICSAVQRLNMILQHLVNPSNR